MRNRNTKARQGVAAGFALPAILIVVSALLIMAVGVLLVTGIERSTARSFVDRQRAELAAEAGLEDVRGILIKETANDDFLVVQNTADPLAGSDRLPASYLSIARGSGGEGSLNYRYVPLFSAGKVPSPDDSLKAPEAGSLIGANSKEFATLPWAGAPKVEWKNITNADGRIVSRYAYWVEDLQSRVDAGTAGNSKDGGKHLRYGWKSGDGSPFARFPAPGLNAEDSKPDAMGRDENPPLDQIALYALDPDAGVTDDSDLDKTIINRRKALVSPDSVLAVAGIIPPLARDADGRLVDAKARSVEENLTAMIQPYDEQPLVPFAHGIDASVTGKPKLNLNSLIAMPPDTAVDEMAAWIGKALPEFQSRKGGFPEDYLKTIAASAIGYSAPGNKPLVKMGSYRGLGASPILSEIVLDINYLGYRTKDGDKIMQYQFVLFAELLNHTNLSIEGTAALTYEVGYNLPPIGPTPGGTRFDDPSLLDDPVMCEHDLVEQNGRYWSDAENVTLAPGEYRFYKFATVEYYINIGSGSIGSNFVLTEPIASSGLSLMWDGQEVERIPAIVRSSYGLTFSSGLRRFYGKAAIPGHGYGPYGSFINNMGDPRIAHYVSGIGLSENSFPGNISPNRRNVRVDIFSYSSAPPMDVTTYGRVIPSEWPDGGHDSQVKSWNDGWSSARAGSVSKNGTGPGFDPTVINGNPLPDEGDALTYLSDKGRYYSATELGRIYDPIMFLPTFDPASGLDSTKLRGDGLPTDSAGFMPKAGVPWPLVQVNNEPSPYFGGGNTLRIGRPEHPQFNQDASSALNHTSAAMPGTHAARLLDLFHAGKSRSNDKSLREGLLVRIEGNVNINTASRDALRAMAAGHLVMDPKLSKRTSDVFGSRTAPPVEALNTLSAPTNSREADVIADAIIKGRPYASPSELACVTGSGGEQVFGNSDLYPEQGRIQWSDSAAEEVFGRVFEASTVRSRNFRIWVVAQAVSPTTSSNASPEVLAEVRKAFTVFADPGERRSDGAIDFSKFKVSILHENEF
jgi:Tfp pilus assembly protein PilX